MNPCRHSQQIYSLSPLTTRPSPRFKNKAHLYQMYFIFFNSRLKELNPQPADYKSAALPIELSRQTFHLMFVLYTTFKIKSTTFFIFFYFFFALKTDVVFRRKFLEQILYQRIQFFTGRKLRCCIQHDTISI